MAESVYLEFCPNQLMDEDFDSPDYIDDEYEEELPEFGDEDENVDKIIRDPPMAMQPPSISLICSSDDWSTKPILTGPFRSSKNKV